jgi:hypothetical protein
MTMLTTIIPIINNRVRELAEFYKSVIEENCAGAVVVIGEKYIEIEYQVTDKFYVSKIIKKIRNNA